MGGRDTISLVHLLDRASAHTQPQSGIQDEEEDIVVPDTPSRPETPRSGTSRPDTPRSLPGRVDPESSNKVRK